MIIAARAFERVLGLVPGDSVARLCKVILVFLSLLFLIEEIVVNYAFMVLLIGRESGTNKVSMRLGLLHILNDIERVVSIVSNRAIALSAQRCLKLAQIRYLRSHVHLLVLIGLRILRERFTLISFIHLI